MGRPVENDTQHRIIRLIEHTSRAKLITPFVGAQADICEAFGFDIPDGCTPSPMSLARNPSAAEAVPPSTLSPRVFSTFFCKTQKE